MTMTEPAISDALAQAQQVIAVGPVTVIGAGTKAGLVPVPGTSAVSLRQCTGIVAYDPAEFTITVRAGTSIQEIQDQLAKHRQYLPFDPPLVKAGATLGGTIATGLNGSNRLAYGGMRDFVLGMQWIDGKGTSVRGGGHVVKNAAGFDFPKFFVGSAGRFGLITETTLKVFPRPTAYCTFVVDSPTPHQVVEMTTQLTARPLRFDAIDFEPPDKVLLRYGGERSALQQQTDRITSIVGAGGKILLEEHDAALWQSVSEMEWTKAAGNLIKVPITLQRLPECEVRLSSLSVMRRYCAAGNVVLIAVASEQMPAVDSVLKELDVTGQRVIGGSELMWFGRRPQREFTCRVKQALDPLQRFGSLGL